MELITAVNSNLNNKNNISYCPPGLLLTKCCFTGHSTNVRRMIPLKWASLSFPNRRKSAYETKNGAHFRPAVNSISDNEIKSRKMYPTNEKSKPYLSFGMKA